MKIVSNHIILVGYIISGHNLSSTQEICQFLHNIQKIEKKNISIYKMQHSTLTTCVTRYQWSYQLNIPNCIQ